MYIQSSCADLSHTEQVRGPFGLTYMYIRLKYMYIQSSCVDLSAFNPGRFSKQSKSKKLRGRAQVEAPVGEQW